MKPQAQSFLACFIFFFLTDAVSGALIAIPFSSLFYSVSFICRINYELVVQH